MDQITVGQGVGGVEIQSGDGSNLGGVAPVESLDVGTDTVTLVITQGMQSLFEIGSIDAPFVRTIEEISLSGTLSSEAHLVTNNENQTSFASFTLDCNSLITPACNGGTVVLNVTFAPLPPGEADTSIQGLIDFLVAQNHSGTEDLIENLEDAIEKIEAGKPDKAIKKLNKFIDGVRNKQAQGKIPDAVAESMIFTAGDIITLLQTA